MDQIFTSAVCPKPQLAGGWRGCLPLGSEVGPPSRKRASKISPHRQANSSTTALYRGWVRIAGGVAFFELVSKQNRMMALAEPGFELPA